ncbi:MAG: hypothetical protein MH825_10040 [Cyanobacteria bacterium]|nr:hypothetical protein [Cyanobacteriota bacterium]
MQIAYMIINDSHKDLVNADDVDYSDYSRIFQCPECKATLTLKGGFRRNGHWVRPSFVHPKGSPSKCSSRNTFPMFTDSSSHTVEDLIDRGQSNKRLEKAILRFLYSSFKASPRNRNNLNYIYYLGWPEFYVKTYFMGEAKPIDSRAHKFHVDSLDTRLAMDAAIKVVSYSLASEYISNSRNRLISDTEIRSKILRYFLGKINYESDMQGFRIFARELKREHKKASKHSGKSNREIDYDGEALKYLECRYRDRVESGVHIGEISEKHGRQVRRVFQYIRKGCSDKFRRTIVALSLQEGECYYVLSSPYRYVWTERGIKPLNTFSKSMGFEEISEIHCSVLERIIEDKHFLNRGYEDFYDSIQNNDRTRLTRDMERFEALAFIDLILSNVWRFLAMRDWAQMPDYY